MAIEPRQNLSKSDTHRMIHKKNSDNDNQHLSSKMPFSLISHTTRAKFHSNHRRMMRDNVCLQVLGPVHRAPYFQLGRGASQVSSNWQKREPISPSHARARRFHWHLLNLSVVQSDAHLLVSFSVWAGLSTTLVPSMDARIEVWMSVFLVEKRPLVGWCAYGRVLVTWSHL